MFRFLRKRSQRNPGKVEPGTGIEFFAKLARSALIDDLRYMLDEGYDNVHDCPENEVFSFYGPRTFRGMWEMNYAFSWFSAVLFLFLSEWICSKKVWRLTNHSVLEECRAVLFEWCSRHSEERATTEGIVTRLYDLWRDDGYPVLVGSKEDMLHGRSFFLSKTLQGAFADSKLTHLLWIMSLGIDGNMAYFREGEVYLRAEALASALDREPRKDV